MPYFSLRIMAVTASLASASAAPSLRSLTSSDSSSSPLQAVHEWGTYISCQGSDGTVLAGVHHEEQELPTFVHTRADDLSPEAAVSVAAEDGLDWMPVAGTATETTQKMETPVLYWYSDSDEPFQAAVNVSFPQGVVTHVYPAAATNLPPVGEVEATADGFTSWDVTVQAAGTTLAVPLVDDDNIWAPSRRVDANYVSAGEEGEADRLVFYRGVGRFDLALHASSDAAAGLLTLANADDAVAVPAAFAVETDGVSRGRVVALGSVAAGGAVSTDLSADARSLAGDWLSFAEYETRASVLLEEALRDAGLFPLEARAMVDTWTRSYFRSPGVRVLYVTPREWVDDVLPLSISPTPDTLERAFVGRVEVMLAGQETTLLATLQRGAAWEDVEARLGRFAEPWLRRLANLAAAQGDDALAERVLARADELA